LIVAVGDGWGGGATYGRRAISRGRRAAWEGVISPDSRRSAMWSYWRLIAPSGHVCQDAGGDCSTDTLRGIDLHHGITSDQRFAAVRMIRVELVKDFRPAAGAGNVSIGA
jgi:hypothetical protein